MLTQVIYDTDGYVVSLRNGDNFSRTPVGIPSLVIEVPPGKQIKTSDGVGVDVFKNPHQVILEDIPPSDIEKMRSELEDAILELTMLIYGGGI